MIVSAQTAQLFLSGSLTGSLLSSVTLEVAGNAGVQTLSFVSATAMSAVVAAINTVKEATGVSAILVDPSDQTCGLTFNSVAYGSDEFVSIRRIGAGGDFFSVYDATSNQAQRDEGRDVTAIVNGALANGNGIGISLHTPALALESGTVSPDTGADEEDTRAAPTPSPLTTQQIAALANTNTRGLCGNEITFPGLPPRVTCQPHSQVRGV